MTQVTIDEGDAANGRLAFTSEITPGNTYYRIVTLTPEGDAAFSDNLIAPSNEPIIYSVTPLTGYQHEEYTFTATASGQEPLTYAWDFGGGASPNASSDTSPTVTLSDVGVYSAILTISNSYGPTTYPFTLTVTARDMWAHTWGRGGRDEPTRIAVSSEGMIYAIGYTPILGAVLLKYNSGGDLMCSRTWGGLSDYSAAGDLSIAPNGSVYVVGTTEYYGPGEVSSALITKFDADCNLLWARAWGGAWRTEGGAIAAIPSGGCYVTGQREENAYAPDDLFVLRLDSDGNMLQQEAWRQNGFIAVNRARLADDGALYIAGVRLSTSNRDGFIARYNSSLDFQWARQWGGQGNDLFGDLEPLDDGDVLVAGYTESYNLEQGNALLLRLDARGTVTRTTLFQVTNSPFPTISLARSNTSWYFAVSGYWLNGSILILDANAESGSLHEAEMLSGSVVGFNSNSDAYMLATVAGRPWGWSAGSKVNGTELESNAVEALGEDGDWNEQIMVLDIEASTPDGNIDNYTPGSDNGDLILMKNFLE